MKTVIEMAREAGIFKELLWDETGFKTVQRFAELVRADALAQPEERNFCPRCGKRTADLTTIHTCTPPQ